MLGHAQAESRALHPTRRLNTRVYVVISVVSSNNALVHVLMNLSEMISVLGLDEALRVAG